MVCLLFCFGPGGAQKIYPVVPTTGTRSNTFPVPEGQWNRFTSQIYALPPALRGGFSSDASTGGWHHRLGPVNANHTGSTIGMSSAPTGRSNPSPGQRPGLEIKSGEALQGRLKFAGQIRPPFQGWLQRGIYTQGVDLGSS